MKNQCKYEISMMAHRTSLCIFLSKNINYNKKFYFKVLKDTIICCQIAMNSVEFISDWDSSSCQVVFELPCEYDRPDKIKLSN